jgi:hypothetical protein
LILELTKLAHSLSTLLAARVNRSLFIVRRQKEPEAGSRQAAKPELKAHSRFYGQR